MVITRPIIVKKIVLVKKISLSSFFDFKRAATFPATMAAPTPSRSRIIVKSSANGSFITYIMIMNMIKSSEVVKIFLDYEISNVKDEQKYTISPLHGITNNTVVVGVDNKNFVLRIPGKNPDVINRKSEKFNSIKAYEAGLTLPFILFDEITGIKISEYFDIYTYKQQDFNNKEMRLNAFYVLNELHNADLVFEENFSPLKVFQDIADASNPVENEAMEVASKAIKKIEEIGIKNVPCHQDLYYANFVIYKNKTLLIDWEYSSMGDSYFDYADLFWQNEFDLNNEFKKNSLIEIGIDSDENIEKFDYFEMLSMITWGLWALKRSPDDNDGLKAISNAIKLSKIKKL